MKDQIFSFNGLHGAYYSTQVDGEAYRNVALCRNDLDGGHTAVRVYITADTAGNVDIAWQRDDLTDDRITPASYDLEYDVRDGFWAAVQDAARDLAAGRIPPECGELEIPGLPEFLNALPDTTGEGLICAETGERLSWEDLDRAYFETEEAHHDR